MIKIIGPREKSDPNAVNTTSHSAADWSSGDRRWAVTVESDAGVPRPLPFREDARHPRSRRGGARARGAAGAAGVPALG